MLHQKGAYLSTLVIFGCSRTIGGTLAIRDQLLATIERGAQRGQLGARRGLRKRPLCDLVTERLDEIDCL